MTLPGTAVLRAGHGTARGVSQLELVFSLEFKAAFFVSFPFITGRHPLHLNPFVCILGLGDVSSVLGPVSGICLILGFRV